MTEGKSKPAFLLDIPSHIIEKACDAYWNTGLYPNQLRWTDLVREGDHRVPDIRLAIHAALSVAMVEPLPVESTQMMTTQFPKPPTTDLEQWAERYAPHQLTAYWYSDASEYMGFEEWLDLNHPGVLNEFETQHEKEHP